MVYGVYLCEIYETVETVETAETAETMNATMNATESTVEKVTDNIVSIICDKYELEYDDVRCYVQAMMMCASLPTEGQIEMTKVFPLNGFEGCLFDPVTRKIYSEVAVE